MRESEIGLIIFLFFFVFSLKKLCFREKETFFHFFMSMWSECFKMSKNHIFLKI